MLAAPVGYDSGGLSHLLLGSSPSSGHCTMPRWLISLLAIVLLGVAAVPLLTFQAWVGGKTLPVEILVVDTEELSPVVDANVVAFRGPLSLFDGDIRWRKQSDFLPNTDSNETVSGVTDTKGRCHFDYRFFAAGSEGLFRHSGYVDTSKVWLRISAADRPTTLVPLDRQSVRPRDIHDLTPIIVTVVLNKCCSTTTREIE